MNDSGSALFVRPAPLTRGKGEAAERKVGRHKRLDITGNDCIAARRTTLVHQSTCMRRARMSQCLSGGSHSRSCKTSDASPLQASLCKAVLYNALQTTSCYTVRWTSSVCRITATVPPYAADRLPVSPRRLQFLNHRDTVPSNA